MLLVDRKLFPEPQAMNESETRIELWRRLLQPSSGKLLAELEAGDLHRISWLQTLRESWGGELVSVALELVEARRRAAVKFPLQESLVADIAGVEQATGALTANHKAERFKRLAPPRIHDLCCGIGGDGMALASVAPTRAYDVSPLRAWMCGENLREAEQAADCRCEDVETLELEGETIHLDPSRRESDLKGRGQGRRAWAYRDYKPGPDFIRDLLERNPDSAVKLGPGIDVGELPSLERMEVEFIQESGRLVQAVLWSGALVENDGQHTATLLPGGEQVSGHPGPLTGDSGGRLDRWIAVPALSLERSSLTGCLCREHGLEEMAPGLGLLTSEVEAPAPWFTSYEVLESMPWRPRRTAAWLAERDAGIVDVKTRGGAVDPEQARKRLRGKGTNHFVVFVLRLGRKIIAAICRPPASGQAPGAPVARSR